MTSYRTLYLDNEDRLGELIDGVDAFQCCFTWWRSCVAFFGFDESAATDEDAARLADFIEKYVDQYDWRPVDRVGVLAFVQFLRGGKGKGEGEGFWVVDLRDFSRKI